MKINLPTSILKYLVLTLVLLGWGCAIDLEDSKVEEDHPRIIYDKFSKNPWVTYILEPGNDLSAENSNHIRKTLNYAKIPYNELNRESFNKNPAVAASVKVIIIFDLASLTKNSMNYLLDFVAKGGHIFIPSVGIDKNFGFLAGVRDDANYDIDTKAQGFLFNTNFIPSFKGKYYKSMTSHYGLESQNFKKNVEILASALSDENYPLIIKNKIGKGTVISFNTEQYSQKEERGLFFAAILEGLEGVPYPIANASSIMLDDFPAPLYDAKMEPVQSEMNISQAKFYSDVWWKDMLKLAEEENLVYSAYVCFDYANHTTPPFNFSEWERSILNGANGADKLMLSIKNSSHELELHGYNHVSLTQQDWPNKSYMGLSLQAVKKRWAARGYGRLPVSYVPPSNIIDSTGFVVLEENIPSIIYNASIYMGDFEEGGAREFDPEPYNYHFFNFPRISSGYAMTPTREFNQQSLYLYTGIWTHFIHPDDIYQIPGDESLESAGDYTLRNINSYGWKVSSDGSPGLLPRFRDYIKEVKETFPFIRFLRVSDAAQITQNWRERPYKFTESEDVIRVAAQLENSAEKNNFWFTYVSQENLEDLTAFLNNKQLKFTQTEFLNGFLLNIQTDTDALSLPKLQNRNSGKSFGTILKEYESYLLVKPSENFADEEVEQLISKLKSDISDSNQFVREDWLQLFEYLGWENRQYEIWPLLEQKYAVSKDAVYVNLASEFTTKSDFPDMDTRRRWMLRQIDLYPENVKLRRDFIGYFGSNTKVQLTQAEILNLIELTDSNEERFNYFLLLNDKYPDAAFNLIEDIPPCREDFKLAASTISWIFSDAKNYEKAIAWSKCSTGISEKAIDDWRLQTGEYEFLEKKNFPLYIEYLIADNNKRAARELLEVEPCRKDLKRLANTIAYTYGAQGSYRKALEWSACAPDFPLVERMQWFYSLKNYSEVERLYANYSEKKNPEAKEAIQIFMTEFYMGRGDITTAWEIASSLPNSANKERLRLQLNQDVLYLDSEKKRFLLNEYPSFFYPEVAAQIKQTLRITEGDFIKIGSNIISDRLDPTSLGAEAVYGIRDKKLHQHQFGLSQYNAYAIPFQEDFENNLDERLYGLSYRFKSRERIEKLNYGFGTRVEFNEAGKAYLHLQASASIAKDSLFSSFQFSRKPAITGPAYVLDIYQTQINIYEELQFKERFQAVLYLEGNHYSDEVRDIQLLTSVSMDFKLNKRSKFRPYSEVAGMLGNTVRPSGYPYWTLDERLYAGVGATYEYVNEKNFWKINLDAGYFLDTFSDQFQRYRGSLVWPVSKYLHFNAQAEFYTLKNFYSNNFTFGLKYFLKDN